jgi:hypothetical protein
VIAYDPCDDVDDDRDTNGYPCKSAQDDTFGGFCGNGLNLQG